MGGSTILTEVPEMFGAETILFERSLTEEVFNNSVDLINDFKKYLHTQSPKDTNVISVKKDTAENFHLRFNTILLS